MALRADDIEAGPSPPAAALHPAKLSVSAKIAYGLGSTADASQTRIIGGLLLLYYSQVLHLPTQQVSLALGVALFIDAFFDLLVAQISDNLRTPLGRRHLLMYASALPAGASFICLWIPPSGLGPAQLFAWLVTFILLFRFSHSLYMVPSGALLPELAPDYHDRTVLVGYRWMLGALGGALAAVLAYGIFLRRTPAYPLGQLNPAGYPPMAVTIGLLIVATSLISSLGTHSRIGGLYRPPARKVRAADALRELGGLLRNHNFAVAVGAGMLAATALALVQGLEIYFNTFMFRMPSSNIMLIVGTQVLSAPIAFLLAPATARRWGKRAGYIGFFLASLAFTHGPIALRLAGLFPANGSAALLPLLMASSTVSGILTTSSLIINTSMIADIVEENQAKTGRRSEGLVLFSDRLMLKIASSVATILPGLLLAVVHFPTGATPATLDPTVMRHLGLIYVPLAVGLSLAAILLWLLFRIDHQAHMRNLEAIAGRKIMADG